MNDEAQVPPAAQAPAAVLVVELADPQAGRHAVAPAQLKEPFLLGPRAKVKIKVEMRTHKGDLEVGKPQFGAQLDQLDVQRAPAVDSHRAIGHRGS